jgi:ATP-dependent Clp protease ATP-binding subunit ClpA
LAGIGPIWPSARRERGGHGSRPLAGQTGPKRLEHDKRLAAPSAKLLAVFERFTERARQVVVLAQDETGLLKHNYICTEHILLGLLREEEGLAARVLDTLGITVEEVRAQVARIVGLGDEVTTGQIAFTPRVKKVLDLALREALSLGHDYIGTEHILLGLVRENEGVAARILLDFDADAEKIRNETIRMLSGPGRRPGEPPGGRQRVRVTSELVPFILGGNQPAHLLVACPSCATPIETISTDQANIEFTVSAEGDRDCPVCGKRWTISYRVSWQERKA